MKVSVLDKSQRKLFLVLSIFLLFLPFVVFADWNSVFSDVGGIYNATNAVSKTSGYKPYADADVLLNESLVGFLKFVFIFLGAAFFLIIVYAGWRWMTASGNEEQITKAKQSLIQASIGFGLVVLAYAITFLVITVLGSGAQYNTGVTPAEDCPYGVC